MEKPLQNKLVKRILPLLVALLAGFTLWYVWRSGQEIDTDVANPSRNTRNVAIPTRSDTLIISEWGVKLPLTIAIADAYYAKSSPQLMHVSTRALTDRVSGLGCMSGIDDIYLARSTALPKDVSALAWPPKRIGAYYYYPGSIIETECAPQLTPAASQQIVRIRIDLTEGLKQLSAN